MPGFEIIPGMGRVQSLAKDFCLSSCSGSLFGNRNSRGKIRSYPVISSTRLLHSHVLAAAPTSEQGCSGLADWSTTWHRPSGHNLVEYAVEANGAYAGGVCLLIPLWARILNETAYERRSRFAVQVRAIQGLQCIPNWTMLAAHLGVPSSL